MYWSVFALTTLVSATMMDAFIVGNNPAPMLSNCRGVESYLRREKTVSYMVAKNSGGGKKKRRRRKQSVSEPVSDTPEIEATIPSEGSAVDISELESIANFKPSSDRMAGSGLVPNLGDAEVSDANLIEVPDIRDALQRKELKKLEEEKEEEMKQSRPKISRKDKAAFLQLLEEQPFADADDSYFIEEEYGTVSALLGEGAKPFLGIPPGPLQVGHFIGSLGIILMAFVEYPGFPLTNLPTPLRNCFQGGLATIYLINTALAVLATFKAPERGQSSALWAAKTFSVGGLAFDQLMQLPTLEQIKEVENRKGARALKNKKKR